MLVIGTGTDPLVEWLKNNFTGTAMAAFLIVALVRGWLIPKPTYDKLLSDREQVIKERDRALDLMYDLAETARRAVEAGERQKETKR